MLEGMITSPATSTPQIGQQLVDLCRQGQNLLAMEQLYDADIISVEASATAGARAYQEVKGIDACKEKGMKWLSAHEIHGATVEGPFMHGADKFAVYFAFDVTPKATGQRTWQKEVGLYTVKNGKITREEWYF